jgi:glycine/D-amino acid oxidase-like deaminating enzyme
MSLGGLAIRLNSTATRMSRRSNTAALSLEPWQKRSSRTRSFWLEEALAAENTADDSTQPVEGRQHADVCIVGGGFTGIWTALRLRELSPSIDVTIVEADICGAGASGRNGGIVSGWWNKFPTLRRLLGKEEALRLTLLTEQAIDDIEAFCASNGIDAGFVRGGSLWTATSRAQLGAWRGVVDATADISPTPLRELGGAEVAEILGPTRHLAGLLESTAGKLQPATLVRGIARVASTEGVTIYERSPVIRVDRSHDIIVRCARGEIRAKTLVLAGNAWLAHLKQLRRSIMVVSSDVIATAAVPERLAEIGWTGNQSVCNSRMMINYYRTTPDGRVVLGRGGGTLSFAGRIGANFDFSPKHSAEVERDLPFLFEALANVPIEHRWAGPIDRSGSGLPRFSRFADDKRVFYAVGYSGNGIAPSLVGARILASRILERSDEWSAAGGSLDRIPEGRLPPEPFRYLGGRVVRLAVARKEAAEDQNRMPARLATALARLVPGGVLDTRRAVHASKPLAGARLDRKIRRGFRWPRRMT